MQSSKLLRTARIVLGVLGGIFILYILWNSREKIIEITSVSSPAIWVWSMLLALCGNILLARVYSRLLIRSSISLDINTGVKVFLLSQIAKYIPGKIWSYLLQISHLPKGTKPQAIIAPNIDLMTMSIVGITSLGAALLLFSNQYHLLALVAMLIGLVGTSFAAMGRHWPVIQALLPKNLITEQDCDNRETFLLFIEFWAGNFLATLAQFYLLRTILSIDSNLTLQLLGISLLSWVVGAIAFLFPAGVGVREWSFIQATTLMTGLANIASAAAIITRLWWVVVDILGGLLVFTWHFFQKYTRK